MKRILMLAMATEGGGISIPQNGLLFTTIWETFEPTASWLVDAGTVAANTTEFRTGTQSLKFTTTVGTKVEAHKTISEVFGTAPRLRISLYYHSPFDITKLSSLRIYIYSGANHFDFAFTPGSVTTANLHAGWVTFEIQPSEWANVGNDWANTQDKIIMRITPSAGNQIEISFDEIQLNPVMKTAVMMTFDDANVSVYNFAYAYMRSKNKCGTFYVVTNDVDTGGNVTQAHLTEMYAAGWSIGNHTSDHANLTTLTQAEVATKLADGKTALDGWGFARSSTHCAYPLGAYNDTVRAGTVDAGMITGRITASRPPVCTPEQNYQITVSSTLNNTLTLDGAKTIVDSALAGGTMIIFYGHILGASAASTAWVTADFQALVDYCMVKGLAFLTINDFYALQSGPVTIQ